MLNPGSSHFDYTDVTPPVNNPLLVYSEAGNAAVTVASLNNNPAKNVG